jgi:hypothetical protein
MQTQETVAVACHYNYQYAVRSKGLADFLNQQWKGQGITNITVQYKPFNP